MKIEKGVPIPPRGSREKFPLNEMEVGDSFLTTIKERQRLLYHMKNTPGKKFITQTIDKESIRCWRFE